MGAIQEIFGKEPLEVKLADIQNLIDKKIEESRNLEYKSPEILTHANDLSQWVSSFLNAEGGLIIIGVCEDNPKTKDNLRARIFPSKIEFVSQEFTKERIEQLISGNIHCSSKPNIKIFPVRDPGDTSKTVFLVEIPQGDNPPYQAADGRYYRRLNVTKYPLSHYEIADFFGRRRQPKLIMNCIVSDPLKINATHEREMHLRASFRLQISISNKGNAAAKYARAIVSFQNIEITKVNSGPDHRIDNLRNNLPTLQWDNPVGIVYNGPFADVIWELDVKVRKNRYGLITWETLAEDSEVTKGDWVLLPLETAEAGEKKKPYGLKSHQEIFGRPPSLESEE